MNKYEIRTNSKKHAILKAALDLFQKNGFVNTNIKEIAALANVSQVSIYNYFGSKNLLVKEAISSLMDNIISAATEILELPDPFQERVIRAIALCSQDMERYISEFFSAAALKDAQTVQLIIASFTDKKFELYKKFIETGKKEKALDETIETSTYLDFIKTFDSIGNTPKYQSEGPKYREDMLKLLLNGLFQLN